jgi:hypothetical protein
MTSPKVAIYARVSTKRCESCGAIFDRHGDASIAGHPFDAVRGHKSIARHLLCSVFG